MLSSLLSSKEVTPPLAPEVAQQVTGQLAAALGWPPYPDSIVGAHGAVFYLGRPEGERRICVAWDQAAPPEDILADFCGERFAARVGTVDLGVQAGYLDHTNARALRKHLPFTAPRLVGVRPAFGAGDRLGIATPAHVRAVRGRGLEVCFAQQSIREMTRTGRTPEAVMDSATFGVFEASCRDGFGADADHLKSSRDIDATVAAGFTMFTIDPGDHVDDGAQDDDVATLRQKFEELPWNHLETTPADLRAKYVGNSVRLPDACVVELTEDALTRAAVKYGRALVHAAAMYRHLAPKMGDRAFELEMSVDETAAPTSVGEHVFVASELKRLGVEWVSLAPRFVGDFEKGVDYIGDLSEFERSFGHHVAVAQHFGPYKISIHSGSDKFSIYPIAARLAGDLIHLKTAGTSYLEALRAIAGTDAELFREIALFAIERYPEDKASYRVSARPGRIPNPSRMGAHDLPSLLDHFDMRQVLHVTFGSVLTAEDARGLRFRDRLMQALGEHEEVYYEMVRAHIEKHIEPFARGG